MNFSYYLAHTNPLFLSIEVLPQRKTFFHRVGLVMYKYSNHLLPECIAQLYLRNEAVVHCPTFVAVNIAKLPVVTADAFNLARMSKDIMSILSIEKNEANSLATLDCLQSHVTSVLDKYSKIDVIANELERLKSAIDRRNGRRVIESDSSTPESNSPHSTIDDSTNDDTDDDDDAEADDDDDVFSDLL